MMCTLPFTLLFVVLSLTFRRSSIWHSSPRRRSRYPSSNQTQSPR
jgi:hypothetical protein